MKKLLPLFLLMTPMFAGQNELCAPTDATTCYSSGECQCQYCLGPARKIANAPVRPYTCNGDWEITLAGFCWKPQIDGLEYAVQNDVAPDFLSLNQLTNSYFKTPHSKWDFGYKIGLGYNSTCDGWDFAVTWTQFNGRAFSHDESENTDNSVLIPLWSNFSQSNISSQIMFATDIEADWDFDLNLLNFTLGREFWVSKLLSLRPNIGLTYIQINQNFDLLFKGGTWAAYLPAKVGILDISNDFKGVGPKLGFDSNWHLGCGWSLYNTFSASIFYGRFDLRQNEDTRVTTSPFTKTRIFESKESFKASRAAFDLALGIKWRGLFCDCKYGLTASLGWEHHAFMNQNQMWQTKKVLASGGIVGAKDTDASDKITNNNISIPTASSVFAQRKGTLGTSGWTLSLAFDF